MRREALDSVLSVCVCVCEILNKFDLTVKEVLNCQCVNDFHCLYDQPWGHTNALNSKELVAEQDNGSMAGKDTLPKGLKHKLK